MNDNMEILRYGILLKARPGITVYFLWGVYQSYLSETTRNAVFNSDTELSSVIKANGEEWTWTSQDAQCNCKGF